MAVLAAAGLAVALGLVLWIRRPAAIRREPGLNVLLVTLDTLRADALGSYGAPRAETPWIDRLAEGGVRFDQAHAHNVVTLPSHANILSGRLPFEHGIRDNTGFRFPADVETLATVLKASGYRTGAFVSAFPLSSRFGLQRGFDVYDDAFLGSGASGAPLGQQERPGSDTVAAAGAWLRAQTGPTFTWVHLYDPHFPYEPKEPFASRFPGAPYAGEVAATDAALRPLLEPLLAAGKAGRTLVVLTADHGESLGEHGEKTHGLFAYEGPLRVPLILFAPRLLEGRVVEDGVAHVDIFPTVLDALGLPVPERLPGRSLLALGKGHAAPLRPSYFEALSAMVNRRWAPLFGVVRGEAKYVDLPLPELYDLAADPREAVNLVATEPSRLEEMRGVLARFRSADVGVRRGREDAETRERLRALGYLAATDAAAPKERYTEDDDPKRLVALDAEMQEVSALQRAGNLAGALALCERIAARRPNMPLAHVQLASLHRQAGRLDAAIRWGGSALALNPDDAETAALLGGYLNDAGRPGEAAALLEPYAAREDALPDVLLARGAALAATGARREALTAFMRVVEEVPTHATAWANVGTVFLLGDEIAQATAAFERALALEPGHPIALNALGVVARRAGRTEEALSRWRRALETSPDDLDALYNLASVLVEERPAEARPFLERFLRAASPGLHDAQITRVAAWLRRLDRGGR